MTAYLVKASCARFLTAAVVLMAMAIVAPSAYALQFTLSSYSVDSYGPPDDPNSDFGLEIDITAINGAVPYTTGDLALLASETFPVFTISTPETNVGLDDFIPRTITAQFTFSAPTGVSGSALTGTTQGTISDNGRVSWNGPVVFSFGTSGQFSLSLSNETFATPGSDTVEATLTYLQASSTSTINPISSMPEPSSIVLLGTGLLVVARSVRHRMWRR
jgi:hypothetical protein